MVNAQRLRRTGRRKTFLNPQGIKIFYSKRSSINNNSRFQNSTIADKPTPPHRGTPGTTQVVNEECKPFDPPIESLLGWGSRFRRMRRQYYRRWKKTAGDNILSVGLGNLPVKGGQPLRAVHRYAHQGKNIAKQFRDLVLKQALFCTRKNPQRKPQATPPVGYDTVYKVGTQNVQGMAELLKHQAVLQLRQEYNLDVLFLTETHSKSYYSFHSEGHLFVVNGNHQDRWSGVTAVIAPHLVPYVKNIVQHSSRILQVTISARSGDVHSIGVYIPHDKSEVEVKKTPFWDQLVEVLDSIPGPEPFYVIGDFNVRLQGRGKEETDFLGPNVYGKGFLRANTREGSNRSLYTAVLKNFAAVDVMSFKQPDLKKQITYKDKFAPPKTWDQFILDPLGWLQLWDRFQSLPIQDDDTLTVVAQIRSYLGADTLPNLRPSLPEVDPYRFQSLDRMLTLKKWLPSIRSISSKCYTGFPSDHFLLTAKIQVKLGAKLVKNIRPPKLEYTAREDIQQLFNTKFRQQLQPDTHKITPPVPSREASKQHILIYTDGSGSRGKCSAHTPAGWGFVRLEGGEITHQSRGPVVTDSTSSYFLGATVGSNNTGELTAWMEAALHALGQGQAPDSVTFCYDSQWAASMVTGKFKAKRNKALVSQAKKIYEHLKSKTLVQWRWVKGHSGEEYNDMADELAEAGKLDGEIVGGRSTAPCFLTPATLPTQSTPPVTTRETLDEHSTSFAKALMEAEKLTFKRMTVVPRSPWITPQLAEELRIVKQKRQAHDPEAETLYRQVKSKARKQKREWVRSNLEEAGRNSVTVLWHTTRRLKKGFRERKTRLKRNGRAVPWSQTHEVFAEHLSQIQWAPSQVTEEELKLLEDSPLLNPPPSQPPEDFTIEELEDVIHSLKKHKAPGPDEVRNELIIL